MGGDGSRCRGPLDEGGGKTSGRYLQAARALALRPTHAFLESGCAQSAHPYQILEVPARRTASDRTPLRLVLLVSAILAGRWPRQRQSSIGNWDARGSSTPGFDNFGRTTTLWL